MLVVAIVDSRVEHEAIDATVHPPTPGPGMQRLSPRRRLSRIARV
jgi:hypothetical protein